MTEQMCQVVIHQSPRFTANAPIEWIVQPSIAILGEVPQ